MFDILLDRQEIWSKLTENDRERAVMLPNTEYVHEQASDTPADISAGELADAVAEEAKAEQAPETPAGEPSANYLMLFCD